LLFSQFTIKLGYVKKAELCRIISKLNYLEFTVYDLNYYWASFKSSPLGIEVSIKQGPD